LDFYCPSAKLAIELDGGGHNYPADQTRDRTRSEFLARHGLVVLRFWNHQVRQELDSVLQAIWFALEGATEKQSLTFILSLWQREKRGRRSACRVSQQEHHRTPTFQEEYRELLRGHGVDFDERYVWD
jgi:hypothetical protein